MFVKKYTLLYDNTIKTSDESIYINEVKKTSENILDLVEPCSLWDLAGDLYEYNIGGYVMIDKVFEDTDFSKREVTAIYKRQSNGDYKRYSAGGKE